MPVRTIERDELRRGLDAKDPKLKLVMTLGDWEFRTKRSEGIEDWESAGLPLERGGA
jgi:hypothetical protein